VKLPADVNERAHAIMDMATGRRPKPDAEQEPTPAQLGGKARAEHLTPEERSEIGRKGAAARWGRKEQTT
jgi:general stress protein YciG